MKKRLFLCINILVVLIVFIGCSKISKEESNKNLPINMKKGELLEVKSVEKFSSINGFKVEDGKFFFSGIKNDKWGFYALDLNSHSLEQRYSQVGEYDVFIPLNGRDAIYVDLDGRLFVRQNGNEKKIDEEIYGSYSPNILVSPDQKGILYTKGVQGESDLYRYMLDEDAPIKIKDKISNDAFFTFSYTTHWSNKSHYFIFDNREVYDSNGKLYDTIDATAAKWSPNDEMIAFIREPKILKNQQIFVGDWQSYIGTEFAVYNIDGKSDKTIYKNDIGLIDAIDNIQWSKDSSLVGLSVGKINRNTNGELENIDYEKIFIYSFKTKMGKEVGNMPYNFYEALFDTYIYGSSIGKRDRVEIVEVFKDNRKIFDKPVILNSKDMFVISYEDNAYLINGRELIEINRAGESKKIMDLPWDISEMYFDSKTRQLIITNKNYFLFVIKM
ncbi:hypothetical protein KQI88_06370 [Alkaliphilus sp. MSJ-5]|uniref:WD40-like Beta Propeller Repeat n=1 Tax=Alkaliphilus flagellatus TaxID=2841507 RepID=A0ABS6G3P4_9FIRM|nr:hypothetical protein [Alkaliphilus flagellatus]MBU5676035.1 hypothetical protein [Alkaliphilus flagellatus]